MLRSLLVLFIGISIALGILLAEIRPPERPAMPEKLRISEVEWKIILTDESEMPENAGMAETKTRIIRIRKGQCLQEEQDSLWHEVHHAFIADEIDQDKTQWTIHKSIEGFTPMELHVLKDNPNLVKYLTGEQQ